MNRYNHKTIEKKWQERWLKEKIYEPNLKSAKKPFYNLMMFPYPSAEGLHVGNMYAFTGSDIYGRFKRMQGYDVFEPIGLDGFGIHSENFAMKTGRHPAEQTKISEKNFYRQLQMLGNGFAWDEKLETYDPKYYKWTQWIFTQLFKRGLAYRKKAAVNWCPSCKTVLADEQVLQKSQIPNPKSKISSKQVSAGVCERCDVPVIKKELEQWFFRITNYAERLLENLETLDWSEKIKIAQRNWIGKSEGALIKFQISNSKFLNKSQARNSRRYIEIFTTRPDTLFGATYMVLAPEHTLIANYKLQITNYKEVEEYIKTAKNRSEEDRIAEGREKTGVELKGVKAVNPANKEEIPVFVADYVLGHVGTGAIMAVPAHDQRDWEFAKKFKLPIIQVVQSCNILDQISNLGSKLKIEEKAYEDNGILINSGKFDGMDSEKAKWEITKFVHGERKTQYRLRDWLISRQRYWGPPIPMIFCDKCDWQPVSEKNLPVKLPFVRNFRPTGTDRSPLAADEKFYKVRCPACKSWARRETDVSDTFLDSAWYYLAYLAKTQTPNSKLQTPFSNPLAKKWLPVDMYIGGAEHAVLHLLYVRFLTMALHDIGALDFSAKDGEPVKKFRAHGLIIKDGAKMSKSKGNVVNPDEYIRAYGADALRMYLMFIGPFDQGGDFRDSGIKGITRFLDRTYKLISNFSPYGRSPEGRQLLISNKTPNPKTQNPNESQIQKILHQTIKKVTEDIENLQYNTAISSLMILLNEFEKKPEAAGSEDFKIFLKLLAPFAPHLAEELWQSFPGEKKFSSIHCAAWPAYDPRNLSSETFDLIIQVNGKFRGKVRMKTGTSEEEAKKTALGFPGIKKYLSAAPAKIIFVPDKLINFVS